MHEFETEIVATHYLKKNGYHELFQLKEDYVLLPRLEKKYLIAELETYRNVKVCNDSTCRKIVAIKTIDGLKGIAFGQLDSA